MSSEMQGPPPEDGRSPRLTFLLAFGADLTCLPFLLEPRSSSSNMLPATASSSDAAPPSVSAVPPALVARSRTTRMQSRMTPTGHGSRQFSRHMSTTASAWANCLSCAVTFFSKLFGTSARDKCLGRRTT
eukprot:4411327-Prymnesium_polylepis.1